MRLASARWATCLLDVPETLPGFRFWVRADTTGERPFGLRFETEDAVGMLRVSVHGMLIDGPASKRGYEEHLTADEVRASRFMLVWNHRRDRQTLSLARLDDEHLGGLDLTYWYELVAHRSADEYYLVFEPPEPIIELGEPLSDNDSSGGTIAALEAPRQPERGDDGLQLEQSWQEDADLVDTGPDGPLIENHAIDLYLSTAPSAGPRHDEDAGPWESPPVSADVRYLRRQLDQERARVEALEARIRELEEEIEHLRVLQDDAPTRSEMTLDDEEQQGNGEPETE